MSDNAFRILQHISSFASFIPVVFILFTKGIDRKYYPIAALCFFAFLTEICNMILVKLIENNYFVLRIYSLLELISISLFYFHFFRSKWNSYYLLLPIPLFFIVAFIDYKLNGVATFDNYAAAFESISFSIISLWSFYHIIKKLLFKNILATPFFWFNTGIMFYFGGNLVLFVFDNYLLIYQTKSHLALWAIHSVLNIIYNIVLAIGFWKTRHP